MREDIVCMRENPFYVDTVRAFRDWRYEFKDLTREWKGKKEDAWKKGDAWEEKYAADLCVLFDSL